MRDPFSPFAIELDTLEFEFAGELWHWRGPSPYHFVTVPEEACEGLRAVARVVSYGWGMIPVKGRIGDTDFETSLFPKDGGYVVPIKDAVRLAEGLAVGDTVALELTVRAGYRAATASRTDETRPLSRPTE